MRRVAGGRGGITGRQIGRLICARGHYCHRGGGSRRRYGVGRLGRGNKSARCVRFQAQTSRLVLHELVAEPFDFGFELRYLFARLVLILNDFVFDIASSIRVTKCVERFHKVSVRW